MALKSNAERIFEAMHDDIEDQVNNTFSVSLGIVEKRSVNDIEGLDEWIDFIAIVMKHQPNLYHAVKAAYLNKFLPLTRTEINS